MAVSSSDSMAVVPDWRALDARFGRVPGVTFGERFGGTVAILEAAGGVAVVAIQGGQVLSWRPAAPSGAGQSDDVLWLSPVAALGTGKAVRGGIPVCWPWFGPHAEDTSKPAHGFVRAAPWRVAGSAVAAGRARLVLTFDATAMDPDIWPSRAHAELEITLSETLSVALSTDNVGTAPFKLTQALHTYLNVGDVAGVSVLGLEGQRFIDQLAGGARVEQQGGIAIDREIDRIYDSSASDVVVRDDRLGRIIRVSKSGSLATVVWNPWIEKAARLGDVNANGSTDGYRRMLCIETANAGEDVVTLAPRARHRMVTEISVGPLT